MTRHLHTAVPSEPAVPPSFKLSAARWLLAVLGVCFAISSAEAATSARNMERETEIENELQANHPDLVEPFRAARIAFDKEDYQESELEFQDLVVALPR